MYIKSMIDEIETYFRLFPFENERKQVAPAQNPFGVLSGGFHDKGFRFASEEKEKEVLLQHLERMDEEAIDQLIDVLGEESFLAQTIRRKRAYEYSKVPCELDDIEKSLISELKSAKAEGNLFYQTICYHIDRLGYKSDAEFYNSINMPRQQFSRLRDVSNTLSKKTVLWIIVALQLDFEQANDLLQKAGYRFRKGDMRDVILMYILRNTTYDLYEVNQVLAHFGVAPLG